MKRLFLIFSFSIISLFSFSQSIEGEWSFDYILPDSVEVSSIEIRGALAESTRTLVDLVKEAIDETPPEIIADLMESGVCLAGGVSQLKGLSERMQDEINMDCWVAEDPLTCVARGAGYILDDLDSLARFLVGLERGSTQHI